MKQADLRTLPGFAEWLERSDTAAFMGAIADMVDEEVGTVSYDLRHPHLVHVNYGIQDAVRLVRELLRDPLGKERTQRPSMPPPRYGVHQDT